MKILVECHATTEYADWSGVALLELGQKEIDELWSYEKEMRELRLRHSPIDALRFWSVVCTYAEVEAHEVLDDRLGALYEQNQHVIVPDDFVFPEEKITRTDCDRLYITTDSVFWCAGVKHTDYSVETVTMGWNMFTCWIHGTNEKDKAWCLRCATL